MYTATLPGRNLALKFKSLGNDISGKTLNEIVAVVGPPNAVSSMAHNQMLYQWQATGYHVALIFDADQRVIGLSSEYVNLHEPDASDFGSAMGAIIVIVVIIVVLFAALSRSC
jgi:hypothetical protein